jgi:inner membrane protein
MSSPLAHALVGVTIYAGLAPEGRPVVAWRPWAVAAFAGIAADLDFLPGLLIGDPSRYHHWATHSLVAVLVFVGLVAPLAPAALGSLPRRVVILGAAYGSHLVLDLLTVHLRVPGIPLLWPFSSEVFLSPVVLFPRIDHGASWGAFLNWNNVMAVLFEAALVGTPTLIFCALRVLRPVRSASLAFETRQS